MFSMVWKGIAPWLDKNTVAKIKILASEKEWKPVLHEEIGIDQLPPLYGGLNTAVAPEMAQFFGIDPSKIQYDLRASGGNVGVGSGGDGSSLYDIFDQSPVDLPEPILMSDKDGASVDGGSSTRDSDYHSARHANSIDLENQVEHGGSEEKEKHTGCCRIFCGKVPCLRPCYTRAGDSRLQLILLKWPLRRLCVLSDVCNSMLCIAAILIIVFVSIFISSDVWTNYSGAVNVLIWIAVTTMTLAAVLLVVGFDGILAVHHQNTHLLKFHFITLYSISTCLAAMSIVSLVYGSNMDDLIKRHVGEGVQASTMDTFEHMHFSIAASTGAASLFSYIPGLLGSTIRMRFTEIVENATKQGITDVFYKTNIQKISQLRVVLRCSNAMSLFFSFACIGFGFYGTRQAMEYELNFSVYAPFFLAEMGIVLTLLSAVSFWASSSTKPDVFKAYQYMTWPYLLGIIGETL